MGTCVLPPGLNSEHAKCSNAMCCEPILFSLCAQVDELLCLEQVGRLRIIQESEEEIDQWSCALPSPIHTSQLSMATAEVGPAPVLCQDEGSIMRDREGWKQVTACSCKRNPS